MYKLLDVYFFHLFFCLGFHTSTAGVFATDSSFTDAFGNQNSTLDATGKGPFYCDICDPCFTIGVFATFLAVNKNIFINSAKLKTAVKD